VVVGCRFAADSAEIRSSSRATLVLPDSVPRHPDKMTPSRSTYAGVFLVALANVMYELLLTRIFSVTMWYHFAFMAISMAMLGMSAGALAVFLFPAYFPKEKTRQQLSWTALLFAFSIVAGLALHLNVSTALGESLPDPMSFLASFGIVSVPFVVGGMCITLALTRFSAQVGAVYAADLLGAALGCVLLWVALHLVDGPTAVVGTACLAGGAAICFALGAKARKPLWSTGVGTLALVAFCAVQARSPILRISYVKGRVEAEALYEKWNSFSRVTVYGDPNVPGRPFQAARAADAMALGDQRRLLGVRLGVGRHHRDERGDLQRLLGWTSVLRSGGRVYAGRLSTGRSARDGVTPRNAELPLRNFTAQPVSHIHQMIPTCLITSHKR